MVAQHRRVASSNLDLFVRSILEVLGVPYVHALRCHLCLEGILTWHPSVLAIEHLDHFLQTMTVGLRIGEIYCQCDDHQQAHIHTVVLPLDSFKSDGIDKDVEKDSRLCGELGNGETTRTISIRPDLADVADHQRCKGNVVKAVVDEEEGDDSETGGGVCGVGKGTRKRRYEDVGNEHANARGHEQ